MGHRGEASVDGAQRADSSVKGNVRRDANRSPGKK
jgi:hypothetical protein